MMKANVFKAIFSSSVTESEEIMLLMRNHLCLRYLKGKKLIPLLESKGIFKKSSLKNVLFETKYYLEENKRVPSGCNHSFFHKNNENKAYPEIKKFRDYLRNIKAEYEQEKKENKNGCSSKKFIIS